MDNGEKYYRQYLDGDDQGLYELIKLYRYGMNLYLTGIMGNMSDAELVTEDTFAELAIKKPEFKNKSSFKTWLYAIAGKLAVTYLRRNKKFDTVSLEDNIELESPTELENQYIKNEEKRMLHAALKKLKPEYRQVLYLSFFEDFSNKEISVIMKKSKRQVENLLYNAKKALRQKLEEDGFNQ